MDNVEFTKEKMASNTSSGGWRVKILSIPGSITFTRLAQIVDLPTSHIYLPKKDNNHETRYAWVNNFVSEEEANKFAQQWSGSSILGETIQCLVLAPRSDERNALHLSHEPSVSDIASSSNKQYETRFNREVKGRQDNSKSSIIPAPRMSFATSGSASTVMNEGEKKPPSYNFPQSLSQQQQQRPTSGPAFKQGEISGKLSYINNYSFYTKSK